MLASTVMPRLYARTNAEAHLYMDLRPCSCGEAQFDRHSSVITDDGVLCSRYAGRCAGCGQPREFVFELPETFRPIASDEVEFGGSDPSRLLDPGEWMVVALDRAKRGTRGDLAIARTAVEEVMKFMPDGAERVPDEAFTSERGRAIRDAEPGRFRRVRLDATLQAWADILARYDAPSPVPSPTSPLWPSDATELAASVLMQMSSVRGKPVPVLIEALASAVAAQQGFEGVELSRHRSDLSGQIHTLIRGFEFRSAELRQRSKTSADVDRLLDAIAQTDTEAGRTIAAHRADLDQLLGGLDLAQLSNSLQTLVAWLRDPANANPASMQQLLARLQASVAPGSGDDSKDN